MTCLNCGRDVDKNCYAYQCRYCWFVFGLTLDDNLLFRFAYRLKDGEGHWVPNGCLFIAKDDEE